MGVDTIEINLVVLDCSLTNITLLTRPPKTKTKPTTPIKAFIGCDMIVTILVLCQMSLIMKVKSILEHLYKISGHLLPNYYESRNLGFSRNH